jgi:voltage-gated potassium channel
MCHNIRLPNRKRVCEIIEIGLPGDVVSRVYDLVNLLVIVINLTVSIMDTFDSMQAEYGTLLLHIESITVVFFAVDYGLRVWAAPDLFPSLSPTRARLRYIFSFHGIVDLLSFLPYYLPIFFPAGAVAFRMFRVMRIFRLFRINAYYDALNVITEVIASKRQQLLSSAFIILVLMVASSLCMYSLEHAAQPEVFSNAFSGIWWSVSTLLTIGYGDIYPITTLGKVFSIFITFLGVGMVAIPTGIISAGFVEQYSRIKELTEYANESNVSFIRLQITAQDLWAGRSIKSLGLPRNVIIVAVQRGQETVVPRGSTVLLPQDTLVLGAESFGDQDQDQRIELKEIVLKQQHAWNGLRIRDLDLSRQTIIVLVERQGKSLIPNGDLVLQPEDKVLLYTQKRRRSSLPGTLPV